MFGVGPGGTVWSNESKETKEIYKHVCKMGNSTCIYSCTIERLAQRNGRETKFCIECTTVTIVCLQHTPTLGQIVCHTTTNSSPPVTTTIRHHHHHHHSPPPFIHHHHQFFGDIIHVLHTRPTLQNPYPKGRRQIPVLLNADERIGG